MAGIEELFEGFGAKTDRDQILIRLLKELYAISGATAPPGGLATATNQLAMIAELVKMIDFEIHCVRDTTTGVIYLMEVEKNETTGAITIQYLDAEGNVVVPPVPGDLVVCDASAILTTILAELVTLNATDFATEVTLAAVLADTTSLDGKDFATEVTLAGVKTQTDLLNFIATALEVNVTSSALPTGAATDTALVNLLTELQLKADLTETQPVSLLTSVKTPSYTIDTTVGPGSVAAGARSISIKNNSPVAVTVAGTLLPIGESISWDAGAQNDTLAAVTYNIPATGSLQILTVV